MESSLSNSGSLSAGEASQILKDLLNVGKSPLGKMLIIKFTFPTFILKLLSPACCNWTDLCC